MKTKTFDCVQMKHEAQRALLAEFGSRREQFASLSEFLHAKAEESDWVSSTWRRFQGGAKPKST